MGRGWATTAHLAIAGWPGKGKGIEECRVQSVKYKDGLPYTYDTSDLKSIKVLNVTFVILGGAKYPTELK